MNCLFRFHRLDLESAIREKGILGKYIMLFNFKIYKFSWILLVFILGISCVSIVEKTGQVLDGSAFSEKTIALYRSDIINSSSSYINSRIEMQEVQNRAGEIWFLIILDSFPVIQFRAIHIKDQSLLQFVSLEYLGGNIHGWNEYNLDIIGTGTLITDDTTAILSFNRDIQTVQISSGRIHRYDTRITGSEALSALRNRRERIIALVEWMHIYNETNGNPAYFPCRKSFDQFWKPIIFPEIVSRRKRPLNWLLEGDIRVRADGIRWNTAYTSRVFSEELYNVRNTGTLLRDWEEALSWIYLEYEWENIIILLSQEHILHRIR